MSKDIRSYFSILSTKSSSKSIKPSSTTKKPTKAVLSSDEDIIPETPVPSKRKATFKKRKVHVLSSDSEDDENPVQKKVKQKVNEPKPTLKSVKAADIFGNEPVKQAKVPERPKPLPVEEKPEINRKNKKKKKQLETEKFEDKKFEETLLDLDDDFLFENIDQLDESIKIAESEHCKKETANSQECKVKANTHAESDKANVNTVKLEEKSPFATTTPTKSTKPVDARINNTSTEINTDKTPSTKRKVEDYDPDEDINRHEKRRQSAILYQKYLNRSGPAHHGCKEIPKGKPNCLNNLVFLRTGVLDSLDSDEFDALIKNHGGRTVHSVSKKVNYVVAGVDPGPAKIEKAKSYGIKVISEDEIFDLIKTKSGLPLHDSNAEIHSLDNLIDELSKNEDCDTLEKSPVKDFYGKKPSTNVKSATIVSSNSLKLNGDSCTKPTVSKYFNDVKPDASSSSTKQSQPLANKIQFLPWTEKYKPTNIKSIIGQQGDKSNMKRLLIWLEDWFKNHSGKNKPKVIRPSPWAKNDDGSFFKAALLSGSPGIGKTTTAHLVAKELGFDVVECNASDTRSKRLLQEGLSQLLSSKSLAGFLTDGASPTKKHVLLMDEVDGMAGNEDRGGIQELINLIKNTNIPIICMCNDRNHPKMRSLVNHCFDLRFSKPRLEQIKGAMMSICFKEGIDIARDALTEIIVAAGMDIRQILTNLSVWSAGQKALNVEATTNEANTAVKDVPLGQWEVCHKVFTEAEHKKMTLNDRARLFYHDYSLAPLFVQENYLKVTPNAPKDKCLKLFATAADSISMGDVVDRQIRTSNNWSLLDVQAMYASVIPGSCLRGYIHGQIDFPSWLGKNSKKNKFNRLVSEIQAHMRTSISGSRSAVNLDYVTHLRNNIAKPLVDNGTNGVNTALEIMNSYNLLREDLDSIIELSQWPKQKDPMNMVDSKVKAAFTRAYNKSVVLPYSVQSAGFKKKAANTKQTDEFDIDNYEDLEEEIDSNTEDNDDIINDGMIKAKKPSASKKKETESKPSTSKRSTTSGRSRKKK